MIRRLLATSFVVCIGCSSTARSGPVDIASPSSSPESTPPVIAPSKPTASASAAPGANVTTMFVDSKRASCEGEGVTECLRVKDSAEGSWMLFYRTIEGFTYEPGYAYELRVEVSQVKNPPADSSSRHHRLVQVVSKKRVP